MKKSLSLPADPAERLARLRARARRRRLDLLLLADPANVRAFTGVTCDSALVALDCTSEAPIRFYTDFRYAPMVRRVAPSFRVCDIKRFERDARASGRGLRIGFEPTVSQARYAKWTKAFRRAAFVDASREIKLLRAVKTPGEIARLRAAEALTCAIWNDAHKAFRAGMTEREMARVIQEMMVRRGDGEAFATIVCVGANAAECHHEPDDTVWNGRDAVLVDMGARLDGVCADLTRNILPKRLSATYRRVYGLVREANRAAIASVRPGITGKKLDAVARGIIRRGGFGRCFGHSLGHGVGYEIHEAPAASRRDDTVLEPGMLVTIEPGIYLEGNLGVRIEDLVLVTETGCEVLSRSARVEDER